MLLFVEIEKDLTCYCLAVGGKRLEWPICLDCFVAVASLGYLEWQLLMDRLCQ